MNQATAAAATRSFVIEREFAHPPEKVWRALTQPKLIAEWLMKNDFRPVVGHRFTFHTDPMPGWNGVVDSEVLVADPPRELSYRWNSSGEEAKNGLQTVVTFTLTPTANGTHLRMEQSGFRPERDHDRFYQGAQYGWQKNLATMEGVVKRLG
jgi:uncharacterized protein YndB with AHSA1/START domain